MARPAGDAAKPIIAVFNSSSDTVELLRTVLEAEGLHTVPGHIADLKKGELDFVSFIEHHQPAVIVYDISPPYEANWRLFQHVASLPVMAGRQVVLTSTNARQVEKLAGLHQNVYEIVGKPDDLERVVHAVKEASRARPSR